MKMFMTRFIVYVVSTIALIAITDFTDRGSTLRAILFAIGVAICWLLGYWRGVWDGRR